MSDNKQNNDAVNSDKNVEDEPEGSPRRLFGALLKLVVNNGFDAVLEELRLLAEYESQNEDLCECCLEKAGKVERLLQLALEQ
jgi:hypothetical protein